MSARYLGLCRRACYEDKLGRYWPALVVKRDNVLRLEVYALATAFMYEEPVEVASCRFVRMSHLPVEEREHLVRTWPWMRGKGSIAPLLGDWL